MLLAGPGDVSDIVANHLRTKVPDLVVVMEGGQSRVTLARRRARRMGWVTVAGQILFMGAAMPLLRRAGRPRRQEILAAHGLDATPVTPDHRVPSVNAAAARVLLQQLAPRLVVVNGTRIISGEVLDAVACPFVNIHTGITPRYRGVHGGYWALAEGRPDLVGTTVHLVDTGIDTGGVLTQVNFVPTGADSIATYPYLHLAAVLDPLADLLERFDAGEALIPVPAEPTQGPSKFHTHPTLWSYAAFRARRGVR